MFKNYLDFIQIKINTNELENGMYYTRISTGTSIKTIKMNVIK